MGVYIPNMSKPKDSCWNCKAQYNSVCSLKREHIKFDGILDDCPIIDIVPCKECKHRDPEDKKCDSGMLERQGCIFPVDDDYFCKYGERRADDKTEESRP